MKPTIETFRRNTEQSSARGQQETLGLKHVEGCSSLPTAVAQPSCYEDHIAANDNIYDGGDDGCTLPRTNEDQPAYSSKSSDLMPCPFSVKCKSKASCDPRKLRKRKAWREHIFRTHEPLFYDYCPNCGDLFETPEDWEAHTRPQCQGHREGREQKPTHQRVTKVEASEISSFSRRGKKTKFSNEELLNKVVGVIFPDNPPTILPHPSHEPNHPRPDWLGSDKEIQERASWIAEIDSVPIQNRAALVIGIFQEFLPGLLWPEATNTNDDGALEFFGAGHSEKSTSHLQQNIVPLFRGQAPDTSLPRQDDPAPVDDQLVGSTSASHMDVHQRDADQGDLPPFDETSPCIDPALTIKNGFPQVHHSISADLQVSSPIRAASSTYVNPIGSERQIGVQINPEHVFGGNPEDHNPFCGAQDTESHSPFDYGFEGQD